MSEFFLEAHNIVKSYANHTALNGVSIMSPKEKYSDFWDLMEPERQH